MTESKLFRKTFITTMIQKSVEVRATEAAMTDSQQNFAGSWSGHRNILNLGSARGSTQSSEGFHGRSKRMSAGRVKRKYERRGLSRSRGGKGFWCGTAGLHEMSEIKTEPKIGNFTFEISKAKTLTRTKAKV